MRERVLGVEVVDVSRRHERKPGLGGERDQLRVDLLLLGEPGVLQLDVRRVAPEDLDEPVEIAARVLGPSFGESPRDTAREAAGQRDDALRMSLEELPVDTRLVVVPLEVAERGELDEVRVPLVRLREEREVRVPLRLRAAIVGDVDLAADDRLDTRLARLAVELDRAGERAVVGERDGRHLEPRGLLHETRDAARPVEDRVLRVDVEMDEGRSGHGRASLLPWSEDLSRTPISSCSTQLRRTTSWSARRRQVSLRSALPVTRWSSQYARTSAPRSGSSPALRPSSSTRTYHDARVDAELVREHERAVAQLGRRRVESLHGLAIGTRSRPDETFHPDGVLRRMHTSPSCVRRPSSSPAG